ncbi:hypothetical protein J6590_080837 [Homalodisca vitripennis]|nr:hypothetical protein J6590_080837 [Homalodisca vitripennis]
MAGLNEDTISVHVQAEEKKTFPDSQMIGFVNAQPILRLFSNTVVREEGPNLSKLSTRRDTATHLKCLEQYGLREEGPNLSKLSTQRDTAKQLIYLECYGRAERGAESR